MHLSRSNITVLHTVQTRYQCPRCGASWGDVFACAAHYRSCDLSLSTGGDRWSAHRSTSVTLGHWEGEPAAFVYVDEHTYDKNCKPRRGALADVQAAAERHGGHDFADRDTAAAYAADCCGLEVW